MEFSLAEIDKTCRSCLLTTDNLKRITENHTHKQKVLKISEILNYATNVDVRPDDGLPSGICEKCENDVIRAYEFIENFIESDNKLRNEIFKGVKQKENEVNPFEVIVVKLEDGGGDYTVESDEEENLSEEDDEEKDTATENEDSEDSEATTEPEDNVQLSEIIEYFKNNTEIEEGQISKSDRKKIKVLLKHMPGGITNKNMTDREILAYIKLVKMHKKPSSTPQQKRKQQNALVTPVDSSIVKKETLNEEVDSDCGQDFGAGDDHQNDESEYDEPERTKKEKKYQCDICSKFFSTPNNLKIHQRIHDDNKSYLCEECGQSFDVRSKYDSHVRSHKQDKLFECTECDKKYKQRKSLRAHIANRHTSVKVENDESGATVPEEKSMSQITCEVCGKTYRHIKTLRQHMLSHGPGGKPFLCGICGAGLSQRSGLKKHMLIHTGEKPFECEACGKFFRYSSALILHKRKHTGARPYPCKDCNLRFGEQSHLIRHQMVHTGEKPFACDLCDKRFNRRTNLRVHRKIHTGERSHVCKCCGKAFIAGHRLKHHMMTHHKGEPFHHENPKNRKVPIIPLSVSVPPVNKLENRQE